MVVNCYKSRPSLIVMDGLCVIGLPATGAGHPFGSDDLNAARLGTAGSRSIPRHRVTY